MSKKRRIADYYLKPIVELKDVRIGSYVYDVYARLCYVGEGHVLHSYALETLTHNDTIVYPVTLETHRIMTKMAEVIHKWYVHGLYNKKTALELEMYVKNLMHLDAYDENYTLYEDDIWKKIELRYMELVEHAKALGVYKE